MNNRKEGEDRGWRDGRILTTYLFTFLPLYLFNPNKMTTLKRPEAKESNSYFKKYVDQVDGDDFLNVLEETLPKTVAFLRSIPTTKWDFRYADGKWSVKEVLLHIIDTERIMAYRALRIARNDKTPLSGFEQDDYIPFVDAENRSPESLLEEYKAVRKASIELFRYFNNEMLNRIGTASGNAFSVRALGFVIAGHEAHHLKILKEKYID
jgi:DinB superfamily